MSKAKPQPAFIPPRVIVAYARLTGTRPKYDAAHDRFNFVDELFPVREFQKRQVHTFGIHPHGAVVVAQMFHANQAH